MTSPLQEAIAKALTDYRKAHGDVIPRPTPIAEFWEGAIEAVLGVLRADDDTRYVAITKPMRDVIEYLADIVQTSTAVPLYQIVAAYGAVAPNAKEVGIWECPDGLRAQANCRSNCKAEGHSPCLTCMESFA